MGENREKLYLSNRLEYLADSLFEDLFFQRSSFVSRYVFIEHFNVKDWLLKRLSKNRCWQVVAGLRFLKIVDFPKFCMEIRGNEAKKILPTKFELNLRIEKEIVSILEKRDKRRDQEEIFAPLVRYLGGGNWRISSNKVQNRLALLCSKLTSFFIDYGNIGSPIGTPNNWQEALWQRIFQGKWTYPFEELSANFKNISLSNLQLCFFAISHLPPLYHLFLERLCSFADLSFYVLSPSSYFWEDICSSYERKVFQKFLTEKNFSEQHWDSCFDNSILANLGKVGREYQKIINSKDWNLYEHYVPEDFSDKMPLNLLSILQRDILFLRESISSTPAKVDDSIQLHVATSRLREIEILYDNVLKILEKAKISPAEILVLAPNIMEYEPYIHMVFGKEDSPIDYKISDLKIERESSLVQGILAFLALVDSRWEKRDLFRLFKNRSFQKKWRYTPEDVLLFEEWIEEAKVHWGSDFEHCLQTVGEDVQDLALHHWEKGMQRILEGVFLQGRRALSRVKGIEFSQCEILDRFIRIFKNLREDCKFLEEDHSFSLDRWALFLQEVQENYFAIEENGSGFSLFTSFLKKLYSASLKFKGQTFSAKSVIRYLKEHLQQGNMTFHGSSVTAVHFCNLQRGCSIPSEAIFLIGMQEGFPKLDLSTSLNLLPYPKNGSFTTSERYRYLFLEILLNVRRYLIMSYRGISPSDGCKVPPSILVQEIFSYLHRHFSHKKEIIDEITFIHPSFPFHRSYFEEGTKFFSFSKINYLASKSYYGKQPPKFAFFPQLVSSKSYDYIGKTEEIIDFKDLDFLARDPLRFYFHKSLKIFLEKGEKNEEYVLSFLQRYALKEKALKVPFKELLNSLEKEGKLPLGIFKKITQSHLEEEVKIIFKHLENFNIKREDIFSIHLGKSSTKLENNDLQTSPLEIEVQSKKIQLVGTVSNISNRGIISLARGNFVDVVKTWPKLLVFLSLHKEKRGDIFFLKEGIKREIYLEDLDLFLSLYIEYYWKATKELSPLISEWTGALLKGDVAALKKAIRSSLTRKKPFEDFYFNWAFSFSDVPCAEVIFAKWQPFLAQVFKPLLIAKKGVR